MGWDIFFATSAITEQRQQKVPKLFLETSNTSQRCLASATPPRSAPRAGADSEPCSQQGAHRAHRFPASCCPPGPRLTGNCPREANDRNSATAQISKIYGRQNLTWILRFIKLHPLDRSGSFPLLLNWGMKDPLQNSLAELPSPAGAANLALCTSHIWNFQDSSHHTECGWSFMDQTVNCFKALNFCCYFL